MKNEKDLISESLKDKELFLNRAIKLFGSENTQSNSNDSNNSDQLPIYDDGVFDENDQLPENVT